MEPRATSEKLLIAYALVLALMPAVAHAAPLFELTGTENAGFTGRVSAGSARVTYFNPALLVDTSPGLTVGVFALIERLDVQLGERDPGADVPEVNGAGPESFRHEDDSRLTAPSLPTAWLQQGRSDAGENALRARPRQGQGSGDAEHGYLSLGYVVAPLPKFFVLGVSALLPLEGFLQAHAFYSDEREQFFSNSLHHELYADRLQAAGLAFGTGIRVSGLLAIGASITLGIASAAQAPVYVSDLGNLDSLLIDTDVHVALSLAPHVGVTVTPLPGLRLSATVHSPQGTQIETGFSYVIATGIEQRAAQTFELDYLPWTFGLGAELALSPERPLFRQLQWTFAAGVTYALWSNYRDRHDERPAGRYAFSDVLSPALSVRCRSSQTEGFVSAIFAPSPVPDQTGRTSYVDSDRGGLAAGISQDFVLIDDVVLTGGIDLQLHRLFPRDTGKLAGDDPDLVRDEVPDDAVGGTPRGPIAGREGLQTNSPGYPSFTSKGLLASLGLRLSLSY